MMTWNYRVFQEADGDYSIREVFYAEDGSIIGWTANAVEPIGRSLEELTVSIADFQAALQLPVLTHSSVPPSALPQTIRRPAQTLSSTELRARLGLGAPLPVSQEG